MAEEKKAVPARDIKKMLTSAFISFNLAVLGAGSYLVFSSTIGLETKQYSNEQAERELASFEASLRGDPVLYTMTSFNANLDGLPRRMVRMELSLEMMDEEGYEEVIGIVPRARDSIMRIINSKSFSDIESVQGKLQFKNQIVAELNNELKKGVVKNVYFSEFVIQ